MTPAATAGGRHDVPATGKWTGLRQLKAVLGFMVYPSPYLRQRYPNNGLYAYCKISSGSFQVLNEHRPIDSGHIRFERPLRRLYLPKKNVFNLYET